MSTIHSRDLLAESLSIKEIEGHLAAGTLDKFVRSVRQMPTPEALAAKAQAAYMAEEGLADLDPFKIPNPGDAIMRISRDIEYKLYKTLELCHRAAEVIGIVTAGGKNLVQVQANSVSRARVDLLRSIGRVLIDEGILFQEQAVTGGRRPDFVVPNLEVLNEKDRPFERR